MWLHICLGSDKAAELNSLEKKNKDGLYSNDISIRFNDQYIQEFLARWANRLETIRNLRNEAEHTLDKDTKA